MSFWCNSCQCHVRTPCTSHHVREDKRPSPSPVYRRVRSTKGASKARRDQINREIRNMRELLPIAAADRERLSYLHSMAAICAYVCKSTLLRGFTSPPSSSSSLAEQCDRPVPDEAFIQALHGFLLVASARGRLLYVSENVQEYLGVSMVDVLQGDSVLDLVEHSDVEEVKSHLDFHSSSSPERSFVCSMQTSKAFKLQHGGSCWMLVQGRFLVPPLPPAAPSCPPNVEPLFVALCTPTVNRLRPKDAPLCQSFSSVHHLDMSFSHVSDSVSFYLGFSSEELSGRSWYSLVHPDDLSHCAAAHQALVQAEEDVQRQMVLRLQTRDLSWTWVYARAQRTAQSISCTNYTISDTEARFLRQKVDSAALAPSDSPPTLSRNSLKRRRASVSVSEEPVASRGRSVSEYTGQDMFEGCGFSPDECESPTVVTPPYTPSSCSSTLSHDLLLEALSSPEASPPYFTFPTAVLSCSHSLSPPPLESFSSFDTPLSPSRSYDDFPPLVPDLLTATCPSPAECSLHMDEPPQGGGVEHLSLLTPSRSPQGGGVEHLSLLTPSRSPQGSVVEHMSLLTPSQSPLERPQGGGVEHMSQSPVDYSAREREEISLLAQQISSLARSFDQFRTLSPAPNAHTLSPAPIDHVPERFTLTAAVKAEPLLDDCILENFFRDLDSASVKSVEEQPLGLAPDASSTLHAPAVGLTLHGLHQLHHYVHHSLQQDGLAEEHLC